MPLFISVKSYIYTLPTGRNYAVSYWRKVLHIHYRLEEITPFVISVKSYTKLVNVIIRYLSAKLIKHRNGYLKLMEAKKVPL